MRSAAFGTWSPIVEAAALLAMPTSPDHSKTFLSFSSLPVTSRKSGLLLRNLN